MSDFRKLSWVELIKTLETPVELGGFGLKPDQIKGLTIQQAMIMLQDREPYTKVVFYARQHLYPIPIILSSPYFAENFIDAVESIGAGRMPTRTEAKEAAIVGNPTLVWGVAKGDDMPLLRDVEVGSATKALWYTAPAYSNSAILRQHIDTLKAAGFVEKFAKIEA